MPELPEVEVVRMGLEPMLVGNVISNVHTGPLSLRYPWPDDFAKRLSGLRFKSVSRRAKYLLFHFEHKESLIWHLGMTGQFHLLDGKIEVSRHEHARITLDNGKALVYRDSRRFGYCDLIWDTELEHHRWFASLGPEPLDGTFDGPYLYGKCRARSAPIKGVLMDNAVVVGVGNIYASETLYRCGIHPSAPASRISKERSGKLVSAVKEVLNEAIQAGGSTISDFVRADGKPGYFSHQFRVYGRMGEPCYQCGTIVRRIVQAGRSTFFCPGCQRR